MELFEVLKIEFNNIFAYYYDIPFEETSVKSFIYDLLNAYIEFAKALLIK